MSEMAFPMAPSMSSEHVRMPRKTYSWMSNALKG